MMKKYLSILLLLSIFFSAFGADIYTQALTNANRPEEDKSIDSRRKPDKVLAFFQIQPGMRVLDLFSGGGYYTEILSNVVGDKGQVDAHNNTPYINYIGPEKLQKRYAGNRLANVTQLHQEANALELCQRCYDAVMMILTFHDLYHVDEKNGWDKIDAPALMEKIRKALKPAGVVGIVDHVAATNAPKETGDSLHRIDPQLLRQNMQQWGFEFAGEAGFLRNPQDNYELPMWDPAIRGKTDRIVMKFIRRE